MPTYLETNEVRVIESYEKDVTVIKLGVQGPPGISEADMDYERETDWIDENTFYKGKAAPGSLRSDPVWKIFKGVIDPTDDDVSESWADGNATENKVWDNRASYTYQN